MSNSLKKRWKNPKERLKLIRTGEKHHYYGKHRLEEIRKKISESHRGMHLSEKHKKKYR